MSLRAAEDVVGGTPKSTLCNVGEIVTSAGDVGGGSIRAGGAPRTTGPERGH